MTDFKPRNIQFEDIRADDELLITVKNGSLTSTKQGVAFAKLGTGSGEYWMTEDEFGLVASREILGGADITLLNRELPESWEADDETDPMYGGIEVSANLDGVRVNTYDANDGAVIALSRENAIGLRDYLTLVLEG